MASPNLTEGSIVKSIISLSVPIVFANLLQTAYQLVDTFWVGRLGKEAVAAVSLSFPILFLLISLGGGLAISGTVLISHYKGKKDQRAIDHIAGQTFVVMLLVSLAISIVGYLMARPLLVLMGTEPDVLPMAVSYLKISFLGIVFLFGFFVFQSLMRGVGDVRTPIIIVLGTVLLNLILDPLFIFGYGFIPAFGVGGAALATIGTQSLATIIGLMLLLSGRYGIHLRKENLTLDMSIIKKMFRLGLPASVEQSTRALGFAIMTVLVASFGTLVVASYGIGVRILSFVVIPALGFSMATSTLVGQNMGAGKINRAEEVAKISGLLGFIVLSIVGGLVFAFAPQLVASFVPGEPLVVAEGSAFLRIMSLTFGFIGLQQIVSGAFQGSGNTTSSMILSLLSLWLFQFPLAYILSRHTALAEAGIWWAFPIANVISATIGLFWFLKGTWKQTRVTEEIRLAEKVSQETEIEEGVQ